MRVQFQVTRDHIRDGLPTSLSECPVALAIRDQFPDAEVEVNERWIWIDGVYHPHPEEVAEFVPDFDTDETGRPFSFTLDLPEEYII